MEGKFPGYTGREKFSRRNSWVCTCVHVPPNAFSQAEGLCCLHKQDLRESYPILDLLAASNRFFCLLFQRYLHNKETTPFGSPAF
jgi:hypothetical protein